MEEIKYQLIKGKEILPFLEEISKLRRKIFREWPYLYEGTDESDKEFVEVYANCDAIAVFVINNGKLVGHSIGVPLVAMPEEFTDRFSSHSIPKEKIFYWAEIILLEEYRNKKIGEKIYYQMEEAIKKANKYALISGCEIYREENDERRPKSYRSNDHFLEKIGFVRNPDMIAFFTYKEIGESEATPKEMHFWEKQLNL